MKKLAVLCILFLSACGSLTIDEAVAKTKVSELLELLKTHQYEKTKEYYSDELNESEPVDARAKKFEQIESASGAIQSYKLLESSQQKMDERTVLAIKYEVQCQNTKLTENFVVALEEGKYKVIRHDITNK